MQCFALIVNFYFFAFFACCQVNYLISLTFTTTAPKRRRIIAKLRSVRKYRGPFFTFPGHIVQWRFRQRHI